MNISKIVFLIFLTSALLPGLSTAIEHSCPSCQLKKEIPPESAIPTTAAGFLANYKNPEQQELPANGIYPFGQRMLISGYSSNSNQQRRMRNASFSMDGPHYSGKDGPPRWRFAEESGMKGWFRLRISNFNGHSHWSAVLPQMKTPEGRKNLKNQIENMVKYVQSSPKMNDHIVAWYGYPEEPIKRSSTDISEQRAYLKLVHDVIKATDQKKRPLYISERSDSSQYNMIGNSCFQDGSLKQNFLIASNAYGGDDDMHFLMWQWARDQVITAEKADKSCPSYTGRKRAAISTLAMFRDPKDPSKQNEEWLRRVITHDIYIQLAAGISGFSLYTWSRNSSYSQKTKSMQEKIYTDVLGSIAKSNLSKVFLWGDDRDDIKMEIISGPDTVKWKKYRKWFTAPSIQMRNIQYGKNRYILLVNSSKETIKTSLSGFPSGMMILDMIQNKWNKLESSLEYTLQPNDVRMHKIANMSEL